MAQLSVYTLDGKKSGTVAVADAVYAAESNPALLHQVVTAYASNRRQSTAHTKTRGERSGSGKKPWKQKGTGRARVGDKRNPVWRKGGVAFGPRNERNFTKKTTLQMRRRALAIALSEKVRADALVVVENFTLPEIKTKLMAQALTALQVTPKTCVIAMGADERASARASRNIPGVTSRSLSTVNAHDLLGSAVLVLSKAGVKALEEKLAPHVTAAAK